MEIARLDHLTRSLATLLSRRTLAGALGLSALGWPIPIETKKKRKKTLKKNEFGCVNVGGKCRGNNANCCSGICQGKKGKKDKSTCVAHHVGECQADQDICVDQVSSCGPAAACFRTTGQASFCGNVDEGTCIVCAKDADCMPEFQPSVACVVCQGCETVGSTACIPAAP